jgi:nitrate/nitrite transporter NarK
MLQTWGWRITFMVVGFAAFVWLVPWFLATPKQMRDTTSDPQAAALPAWEQIASLFRNRDFIGVLIGFFCFDYFWYLLLTWLPSYLVNVRHLTIIKAGIYAALPMVVFGLAQPLGGGLADHLISKGFNAGRTRKTIISIAFLCGLLIIPAANVTSPNTALLLLMGCCLVGFSAANQLVLLQNCTPPKEVGVAVGVYNFVGNIAGVLAPIITGYIIKINDGSYTPAFVLAAVMMAASQFAYWFIVGPIPRREMP